MEAPGAVHPADGSRRHQIRAQLAAADIGSFVFRSPFLARADIFQRLRQWTSDCRRGFADRCKTDRINLFNPDLSASRPKFRVEYGHKNRNRVNFSSSSIELGCNVQQTMTVVCRPGRPNPRPHYHRMNPPYSETKPEMQS
jgi:hypothetical protein